MRKTTHFLSAALISVYALGISLTSAHAADAETLIRKHNTPGQTTTAPTLAKSGEWTVGVSTIDLVNPGQLSAKDFKTLADRPLKLEIWYPTKAKPQNQAATYTDQVRSGAAFTIQGQAYRDLAFKNGDSRFPLVVMSHGYTGYRTLMYYLAEHLASHGYVVASPDHTDSTNADVDFSTNPGSGFPSAFYNRARDQQFVLDSLTSSDSKFAALLQADSAAVIGYSMGGYGALNTVGGCYDFSATLLKNLGIPEESVNQLMPVFSNCAAGQEKADERWQAMVAFAPWGGEQGVHSAKSLSKISLPSLIIGGDQDDVSGFDNGIRKLYQQLGAKKKYLMVYENARHNIAGHPAPSVAYQSDLDIGHYFEPSWSSETITQINEHIVLAFLDCHVKNMTTACDYLPKRESATQIKQADGKYTKPWPGFSDRWGVGIRFIRAD